MTTALSHRITTLQDDNKYEVGLKRANPTVLLSAVGGFLCEYPARLLRIIIRSRISSHNGAISSECSVVTVPPKVVKLLVPDDGVGAFLADVPEPHPTGVLSVAWVLRPLDEVDFPDEGATTWEEGEGVTYDRPHA